MRNQTRKTPHSDVSRGLRNAHQPRSVHSGYYTVQAEPHMRIMSLAFIPILRLSSTATLIDVTLAAHNRQYGGPEYSVGAAAILRAGEKHDMYNRTFDFSSDSVRLEILAIETSGTQHRARGTSVSSCPCYSNRSPQSWFTVQQHSQNSISCCSNCMCQVCHHCKRPPHAGYGPLSSLH